MGYRYYFYAVPKQVGNEITACKTNEDLIKIFKANSWDCAEEWCYLPRMGKEIYEFGKEIDKDLYDAAYKCNPLLSSKELQKLYEDYNPRVCTQETFKTAIKTYHKQILDVYEDLMREKSIDSWNTGSQFDRMKAHIFDHYFRWKEEFIYPYNDDLETPNICHSWMYEHAIFELVRCYKTFDWQNDELIFIGY